MLAQLKISFQNAERFLLVFHNSQDCSGIRKNL